MSITIIPGAGSTLGPGFLIDVSTTVTPTNPGIAEWWVYIQRQDESEQWLMCRQSWSPTQTRRINIGYSDIDDSIFIPAIESWNLHQSDQRLLVQVKEGTEVIDSGSIAIVLDNIQGVLPLLQQQILRQPTQGGFTESDRVVLMGVQTNTLRQLELPGVSVDLPVSDLVVHPPLGLARLDPNGLLLTGSGQINLPGQPGVLAYGVWWECLLVPPEVGIVEGLTPRYRTRVLQLNVLHQVAGVDVVTEVLDADFERVVWRWSEALPFALAYQVAPGFEVSLHILTSLI